jgi:predicted PurR-regulated permease PerM
MRAAIVIVAVAGLLAPALATSSFAQTQRLPRRSPAEQQVDEINRSLTRKQQRVGSEQQNQIETNQLRQEIHRQNSFPSMTGPGSIPRICSPGSSTC